MNQRLHRVAGYVVALLLLALAATGAALALESLKSGWGASSFPPSMTVAEFLERVERHGTLERVCVAPSGEVVARFHPQMRYVAIDPVTFDARPAPPEPDWAREVTQFHRTLGLGEGGRFALSLASAATLALIASGVLLAQRRGARNVHRILGLAVAAPLALSAATGLILGAVALAPQWVEAQPPPAPPAQEDGQQVTLPPASALAAFKATPLSALEELIAPPPEAPEDSWRITTGKAVAYVDPLTGEVEASRPQPWAHGLKRFALGLHVGAPSPWLALVLGLGAAATTLVVITSVIPKRRGERAGAAARRDLRADIAILSGSEGGTTRVFAARLARSLRKRGWRVQRAAMNEVGALPPAATALVILTATYGEGEAPSDADRFLALLPRTRIPGLYAVLGFGDRRARRFCGFAEDVDAALRAGGRTPLVAMGRVHRCAEDEYQSWSEGLIDALDRRRAVTQDRWPGMTESGAAA